MILKYLHQTILYLGINFHWYGIIHYMEDHKNIGAGVVDHISLRQYFQGMYISL